MTIYAFILPAACIVLLLWLKHSEEPTDLSQMSDNDLNMEAFWEVQSGRLNNPFSKEIKRRMGER